MPDESGMRGSDDLAPGQSPTFGHRKRRKRRRKRRGQAQPYSERDIRAEGRGDTLSNILRGTDGSGRNPADNDRERLKRLRKKKEADKRG